MPTKFHFKNYICSPEWKTAQIKIIVKPGNNYTKFYRPISLLPILSKVMEILFLSRSTPIIVSKRIIPEHQYGSRKGHGTVEQVHRVVNCINKTFDKKEYCTAVFLYTSQAYGMPGYYTNLKFYCLQTITFFSSPTYLEDIFSLNLATNSTFHKCGCTTG